MKGVLAIPEFLRKEPRLNKRKIEMTDIPSARMPDPDMAGLANEETKKILSDICDIDEKIKDLQKEKATLRRKYQSALGKLITAHIREQISK